MATYLDRPKIAYKNKMVGLGYNLETLKITKDFFETGTFTKEQLAKTFQWLFPDICPELEQAEKIVEKCIKVHQPYTESKKQILEYVLPDMEVFEIAVKQVNNLQ